MKNRINKASADLRPNGVLQLPHKKLFTFLEILIVVFLVASVSSAVVWKMGRLIEKKRFQSSVDLIESRMATCRKLAINMQADWKGVLEFQKRKWVFLAYCQESRDALPMAKLDAFTLLFDGKSQERIEFDFSSTGEVAPKGDFVIRSERLKLEKALAIPDLFLSQQGKRLGPLSPDSPKKEAL